MTGRTARVWSSAVPAPVLWRDAGCLQIPVFPILGHVPVSTLYKHRREWQLTAYRVGRTLKFRERDSEVWLERQPCARHEVSADAVPRLAEVHPRDVGTISRPYLGKLP